MTKKTCSECKEYKHLDQFNIKDKSKGTRSYWCRECSSQYLKNYYQKNKKTIKRKAKEYSAALQKRLYEYLSTQKCFDCSETRIATLQFDHVRGTKLGAISTMRASRVSWARIKREIDKCEVRCANCHAIRTAEQFGWYKNFK